MPSHPESIGKRLEEKSWAEIASVAREMQIRLEHEEDEARKLEAQLRVIKQALVEHMEHPRAMAPRIPEFHSSLSAFLSSAEAQLRKYNMDRHEFVNFLQALLLKLKSEKLKRAAARKAEFTRHKR